MFHPGVFFIQIGGALAFLLTLVAFWNDIEVRKEQSINSAWQILATSRTEDVGNIGASAALQLLARNEIILKDIRLSGAFLRRLELNEADLGRAQFGGQCINSILQEKPRKNENFPKRCDWIKKLRETRKN